ncbi:MarR family winged helix-turn-helix transcriptional regulator [Caulobacter sp. KR2-114]|uniref:MarR family winged helix-turn-helix transcriptional regulator n=1 Tax=Caulobacter sp. KR2-114 TaxID=3400912 RepID=UPI003C063C3D
MSILKSEQAAGASPQGFPYADGDYLFHLLVAISRYRDDDLETAVKPLGLTLSHYRAMVVIAHFAPCTMGELADFSMVDRTTLTRTIDHLVARGLVDRCHSQADRRQLCLTLTETGWSSYLMAQEVVRSRNDALLAKLPAQQMRAMIRAQQALVASWDLDKELAHRLLTLSRGDGKSPRQAAND